MVDLKFVETKWEGDSSLSDEALSSLDNAKTVSLFSSIQFNTKPILEQLESRGIEVIITKAKRASINGQVLGCNSYSDSFTDSKVFLSDKILYVGDGMFHPKALLLSQIYSSEEFRGVIVWNPVNQSVRILGLDEIKAQCKKIKSNLMKFLSAKRVGILVSTKHGQEFLDLAIKLKKKLTDDGKEAFIFIDDAIKTSYFEDFNFIDSWVNSACPRIGQDDVVNFSETLINIKEAFDPGKYLGSLRDLK